MFLGQLLPQTPAESFRSEGGLHTMSLDHRSQSTVPEIPGQQRWSLHPIGLWISGVSPRWIFLPQPTFKIISGPSSVGRSRCSLKSMDVQTGLCLSSLASYLNIPLKTYDWNDNSSCSPAVFAKMLMVSPNSASKCLPPSQSSTHTPYSVPRWTHPYEPSQTESSQMFTLGKKTGYKWNFDWGALERQRLQSLGSSSNCSSNLFRAWKSLTNVYTNVYKYVWDNFKAFAAGKNFDPNLVSSSLLDYLEAGLEQGLGLSSLKVQVAQFQLQKTKYGPKIPPWFNSSKPWSRYCKTSLSNLGSFYCYGGLIKWAFCPFWVCFSMEWLSW